MGSYFHPKFIRDDPKLCLQMCSNNGVNPTKFSPMLYPGSQQPAQNLIPVMSAGGMTMMPFMPGMIPFGTPFCTPTIGAPGSSIATPGVPTDANTATVMQQQQVAMMQQLQQFQIQQFQQFQAQMQQQNQPSVTAVAVSSS